MPVIKNAENFLVTKKIYRKTTIHHKDTLDVAAPASQTELNYQALLSAANQNFFNREYTIALDRYLNLRHLILVQSHPEMPKLPKPGFEIPTSKISIDPLIELSRKFLEKIDPGGPVINPVRWEHINVAGEFAVNPVFTPFQQVGAFKNEKQPGISITGGRKALLDGKFDEALQVYNILREQALADKNTRLAAQITSEAGALLATHATGAEKQQWLGRAKEQFDLAAGLFKQSRDAAGEATMLANLKALETDLRLVKDTNPLFTGFRSTDLLTNIGLKRVASIVEKPQTPASTKATEATPAAMYYIPVDNNTSLSAVEFLQLKPAVSEKNTTVGLFLQSGVKTLQLEKAKFTLAVKNLYNDRVSVADIDGLSFWEEAETNFVAYIPHLFFFVLPLAIADTYLAMGLYGKAENEYLEAAKYTFINHGIEAPFVWQKLAENSLRWGNELFRQEKATQAKQQFEKIVLTIAAIPASVLYQGKLAAMTTPVSEVIKEIKKQPHTEVNYKVYLAVMKAYQQLQKIKNNLNFLGLSNDYLPIFRFRYLQAAASYMADQAIQTERTFISFRSTAENQKFERMQLQSNLELQQSALRIEQKRAEDAALEVQYASQAKNYAELRKQHAQDTLTDWNTKGWELTSVNAALSWASNAANDQKINYTGVQYNGESHNYSGDVEDFYDTVGEVREVLNWELQRNRLERQASESAAEVALAATRQQQAAVRLEVQQMTVDMAQKRVEGAQELLDYARDRMFDEEMWFRLAAELQDLSRDYLDMAVYAAFLMERAYDLEFDRALNRIRFDYGIGGVEGLLGGDYLKRDIDSFTLDYLQHAQKKNPVRLTISLREQFPAEFNQFISKGRMNFRTDLEIFDRLFPGTYRRKLKKLELFVEGLVPVEGAAGFLTHAGISTEWRSSGISWGKHNRVTTPEQMVLSSYQFRRDISVFQPSDQMLGQFENLGPQGNWTLELPRSSNNLDYNAISDIKLVLYFDADYSESLRSFLKTFYLNMGGRSVIYSARFHFPDQYFRMDADKRVAFELGAEQFAYNYTNLQITGMGIRLLGKDGAGLSGKPLKIIRKSDGSSVTVTTSVGGLVLGNAATMAPFNAWKNSSPVNTFTIEFPAGTDTALVGDIQFSINYTFNYRADA